MAKGCFAAAFFMEERRREDNFCGTEVLNENVYFAKTNLKILKKYKWIGHKKVRLIDILQDICYKIVIGLL